MMNENRYEKFRTLILHAPFYIMAVFAMIYMGTYVRFNLAGKQMNLDLNARTFGISFILPGFAFQLS